MQVTETLSDGLRRGFTVIVPASDIETRRSARLADIGRTLRLPGFRPGKVPPGLLRQRYGSAVTAEILEQSVTEATQQVLSDRGLRPAVQPKVDVVSLDRVSDAKADLEFKVEVELLPEIALPDFSALALTRLRTEAPAEQVDRALADIAARQGELIGIEEDRGAAAGETLTVDFVGSIDGVAFEGGTAQGVDVEIGGTGFIPGFSEALDGLRVGETRTITATFPETYQVKDLAGKPATFEVTARQLRRAVRPPIDDDLARKLGFEGLDEVRRAITAQVQREYDQMSRFRLKRQVLDQLAEQARFPVPQSLLDAEFGQIWNRVEADRTAGRADEDDAGKDETTLRAEYAAIAERRVRLGLLLAEIGRANGVTVTSEELGRAIRAEASRYPGQEQEVVAFFRKNPQAAEGLRGPLFEDKVVDFVIGLAQVSDQTVTPEALLREAASPGGQDDLAAGYEDAGAAAADMSSGETQPQSSGAEALTGD